MTGNNSNINFSDKDVKRLAKELYGIDASVKPMDSYIDKNFHLTDEKGGQFVFKIANADEEREILDAQHRAMAHIAGHNQTVKCPSVCPALKGEEIVTVKSTAGTTHLVRMLTFLPGTLLADVDSPTAGLIESFGRFMGSMDKTLTGFSHHALNWYSIWDLKHTLDLGNYIDYIDNPRQRNIVRYVFQQFETFVVPVFPALRCSVVHSDANDFNILVGEDRKKVTGIIDFGDMVHSCTVFEPAIAAAYAVHRKDNPMETAAQLVAGYHKAYPLTEVEVGVLFYVMCARLCATVTMGAYQYSLNPGNEYLNVSVQPARDALEKLIHVNPQSAHEAFREACGMPVRREHKGLSPQKIMETRRRHLGKALSLSYKNPLKIVRGFMQYLYDHEGRAYLDTVNNVCHVGHCHPRVVRAAQQQMAVLNTNTRYLHDNIVEYAQRLCALLPEPLSVCYFVCSGSEANELAIRMARTHTKSSDFIVVDHAYHGNTNAVIDISPYKFDGPGGTGAPDHVHKVSMPGLYRGPYKANHPDAGKKYAEEVGKAVEDIRKKGKQPAAFMCESLMGVAGQVLLPDNYLKEAFNHVRKAGGVCIADEVQVGFGRVGTHMWGFQTQDVVPDIITLGKPIGNGHPLAAVVTTPEIAASFANGMEYFNTFGGNPVSCAVGLAVLDVVADEKLQENALNVGAHMKAGLEGLKKKHPLIGDVRGTGLFLGIELVKDRETLTPAAEEAAAIAGQMKEKGILVSVDGPLYNVLKIKPPLVFSEANADLYIAALDEIL